jgi:hypothetical protein
MLALAALPAAAQSLPSKKEAAALLQKAADAADLGAPDTPPYHLGARVRMQVGDKAYQGTYDLRWAAPDKYREAFQVQVDTVGMAETDLALADKFYTLRNTTTLSFELWEVRRRVRSVQRAFFWGDKPKVSRVFSAKEGGEQRTCIDSGSELKVMETCFDPRTGEAVSSSLKPNKWNNYPPELIDTIKDDTYDFRDFATLSNKRYPRQIKIHEFDLGLEIEVVILEQVNRFDDDIFVPPDHASESDWCAKPDTTHDSRDWNDMPQITMRPPGGYFSYYVLVGRDGRFHKFAPLRSAGKQFDGRVEEWVRGARFGTESCAGKPIEWELVFTPPIIFSTLR